MADITEAFRREFDSTLGLAIACKREIDAATATVLAAYPWNCCGRRANLNRREAPAFGYARQFMLPADCLRVWTAVLDPDCAPWSVEGRGLLTDATAAGIVYSALVPWPQVSADVETLVALRLAATIAQNVTENAAAGDRLTQQYEMEFRRAKAADARERGGDTLAVDSWTRARRGG